MTGPVITPEMLEGLPPKDHCLASMDWVDLFLGDRERWMEFAALRISHVNHRFRQRQQRLAKHGRCGRFDRRYR